jgi:hypothetical protein
MCIRCRALAAPEPLGYCAVCALHVRVDATRGFRRLAEYLAAWAAFDDWCREGG